MAQHKKETIKPKASSPAKSHSPYILLVEDEPTHVAVMSHTIRSANSNAVVKVAVSLKEYRSAIEKSLPEIALIDMHLPDGKALEVLTSPLEDGLFPIVVMTSSGDEKIAVKAMKAGALDYIVKSTEAFKTMPHTIERAISEWKLIQERKKTEEELRASELRYRSLYENVKVGLYRTTPAGKIILANQSLVKMLGYETFEQLAERNLAKTGFGRTTLRKEFLKKIETDGEVNDYESTWTRQDGSLVIVRENARAIRDSQGKTLYYDGTVEDITEHRLAELAAKYAEDALRESEQKYHSLFDNAVEGIYYTTPEGRFINVNSAFAKMLGYESPEEIITNVTDIGQQLYANSNDRKKAISTIKEKRFLKDYEIQMRKKDGSTIWASFNVRLINTQEDRVIFEGSITDITERKQVEEALRKSEERLYSFMNSAYDTFYLLDKGLNFVEINKKGLEIIGKPKEEVIGKNIVDIVPDVKTSGRFERHLEVLKTGIPFVVEDFVPHPVFGNMHFILKSFKAGDNLGVIASDITERKQADEALHANNERLHLALDSANSGAWEWNLLTNKNIWSDELWKLYGLEPHSCVPSYESWRQTIHPDDRENVEKKVQEAAREGNELNVEWRVMDRNGSVRWLLSRGRPLRDAHGKINNFIGIVLDISERKRADEALRKSEEQFKTLFMSMSEGFYISEVIYDDNGNPCDYRFVEVNPKFEQIVGLNRDQIIGKRYRELVPVDTTQWLENYCKVARTGISSTYEFYSVEYQKYFETYSYQSTQGQITVIVRDITERKRTEAALIENEARYRTLVTQSPDGIFIVDCSGTFLSVNKSMCDKLKYSEEELLSMKIWDIVPQKYLSLHKDRLAAVLKGESKKDAAEYEVKGKDGIVHFIEVLSAPYYKGKEIIGFHGIARDITERKQVEEALRESESQFRELWGATVEGITILDNGIIVEVNDAMCQMLGYTREYALGKSILEFAPAEVCDQIRERITTKSEGHFEIPAVRADGTIIQLETFAKQIIYQGKHVRMISVRDITEQKQVERTLRENEQFFRLLFTTSPDSILIFDPFSTAVPWEILDCNEVACRMNGYTREELIGKSIDMLNAKVLTSEEREAHIKRLQQKGVVYFETFHRHRDGHVFPIDVASSIVTLGGRQLILGIDRDITSRKQVEEALRQMQKLEGLGTLAGGIAHDFNNILGIILAYNTGIKRFKDDAKKLDHATETITKAVQRGKTLVQQILTFARKTETTFGAVNVNDVVMEVMAMILETFPKTLTYAQNFEKGIPFINADRSQLYQALLNLCVNARDAMSSGGSLAINTRIMPGSNVRTQHPDASDSNYICIEVSDTGEGMTEEIRKRIFEPFFTTKGIGKGTGLGLAVVFGVDVSSDGACRKGIQRSSC
jgi:PAS domain S-box-containing protein